MAVRLVCRACGKRLKLPDQIQPKKAVKCPKCLAVVDLTTVLEASAYQSAQAGKVQPPPLIGEADPQPVPPKPHSKPKPPPLPTNSGGSHSPLAQDARPSLAKNAEVQQEILSLDDDPEPAEAPPEVVPFRVPVRVLADSLRQFSGPCRAVIVPHGVFLEHEPMKPLLYFPVGCAVESPASGELTILLPDRRAVTLRFGGRSAHPLARDTRAFLAGDRPAPVASEYRRKWWMLWAALIFALGLAVGPLVLSQTAELGLEFGLQIGGGFALVGLLANTLVVLFSRRSVFGQMVMMASLCVMVTGLFLFGATAYMAGRQRAFEEVKEVEANNPAPTPGVHTPGSPNPSSPEPLPARPPSHLDRAKKNGSSALEDGSSDVLSLALATDGNTLGIGHADGTTRIWQLDQPTFEAMQPGPKADGPVTRMQFDRKGVFVFAHTATGVIVSPRIAPLKAVKIPGTLVAIASDITNDRIRFAAVRGNTIQTRFIGTTFVTNPPVKEKGLALPGKGDEVIPKDNSRDPNKPPGPTFIAWGAGDRLFAGQPTGTIAIWSATMRPEAASNDHKAAVKAWAECASSGDFATGDDKGNVGLWSNKGTKPTMWPVFDGAPVTGLSFNSSGTRLAITDNTGWLVIWDATVGKAIHRVKRPAMPRAVVFGPTDDVMILSAGRTVEVWSLPELVK